MSNGTFGFSRAQLKAQAKQALSPNWPLVIAVTLIYLLCAGAYSGTNYNNINGELTVYDGSSVANFISNHAGWVTLGMLSVGLVGLIGGILVDGVLSFAYSAWMLKMAELDASRKISFGEFVDGFRFIIKAALAYLWQSLWTWIWGLMLVVPGMIVMMLGFVAWDGTSFLAMFGVALMLAAVLAMIWAVTRYSFLYQVIADSQGKVGVCDALRYSIAIISGHVGDLVMLFVSFIPWMLLGGITFGLAFFYVTPYMSMTLAMAYRWMRDEAFREGRLDPALLGYMKRDDARPAVDAAYEEAEI
ncbi:MAG: DUF975 family protein [Peptococcaceae bacterium]|nr:DUF975 family protein [Peptococcaceae bacterium]